VLFICRYCRSSGIGHEGTERPGQLATKDELLGAVWGAGTAISDTDAGRARSLRPSAGGFQIVLEDAVDA
jgi:hypothetical protein